MLIFTKKAARPPAVVTLRAAMRLLPPVVIAIVAYLFDLQLELRESRIVHFVDYRWRCVSLLHFLV